MTFYHVYTDESRQDAHRYMLYGMLLIPRGEPEQALQADIRAFRQEEGLTAEMKWGKVSRGMLPVYKRYVDLFFNHLTAEFYCLVVDTHKIDYRRFHDNDRETAFFNFYFDALAHPLAPADEYLIYADDRQNKRPFRWRDLQTRINEHWRSQGAPRDIVRNLQPVDSKRHDLLQIADILTGAIGYDLDEYDTSAHRLDFAQHVAVRVGCDNLRTHEGERTRFSIRRFRFAGRGAGAGNVEAETEQRRHPS